jgi:predicted acyl esterase
MKFAFSDVRDGMRREFNADIVMDDGVVIRADIFRPDDDERHPVLLTYGPYGKGLAFQDGYAHAWHAMCLDHPDIPHGSSNLYQSWELVDPEKWVPDGYVCLRVDSRGTGCSEGHIDHFSARETKDLYDCIEWAGVQPWSNGKVGLDGISYYSMNAWVVGAKNPPHLAAMCIWEGCGDFYRDATHHGGILSMFWPEWYGNQVESVQYGRGDRGYQSRVTGQNVSGQITLSDEELAEKRSRFGDLLCRNSLDGPFYRERSSRYEDIRVPLLSAANWGGIGLHTRGNFEGFRRAGSGQKWLEAHGLEHWTHFYTEYGVTLQKRFFGHFLKGEDTGWDRQPTFLMNVRHVGEKFVPRAENEWPLARTQWQRFYLSPDHTLAPVEKGVRGVLTYAAMGDGITFLSAPFAEETEIGGPCAAKLFISSDTADADLFLVLRLFSPDMKEVTFKGSNDPHTPISLGWLRASHRKLDRVSSKPYMPYHAHDEHQALVPGGIYELDIEILPTSIVIPRGYRLALSVRGKDYETAAEKIPYGPFHFSGVGPHRHTNAIDRKKEIFHNNVSLHFDEDRTPFVLLPIISQ